MIVLALALAACVLQDDPPAADTLPPARTEYYGRTIAPTMHFRAAPWLTRPQREREESTNELLAQLRIEAGHSLCDLGCGNGYYTIRMAQRLQEANERRAEVLAESAVEGAPALDSGAVFAVDIQPEMLTLLETRSTQAGVADLMKPVLGTLADPKLPKGVIDLVLLVDVYHEFSHPECMLRAIRQSLSPKGVVALAEFRLEDPNVPIKLLHKMTKEQILKEFLPNGFRLAREYDDLPWQHLMFFERDPEFVEPGGGSEEASGADGGGS